MKSRRAVGFRRPNWVVALAFLGALSVASILVLRILASFFTVLALGLVAACLIYPGYLRMVSLFKGHRRAAAVAVCMMLMVAVLAPILVTVQALSKEALSFYEMITVQVNQRSMLEMLEQRREELEQLNRYLGPFGVNLTPRDVYQSVGSFGVQLGAFFYKEGVALAKGVVRLIFGFCFWLLILYYLLVDGERLTQWFLETLPMPSEQQRVVIHRFTDMSASLVVGNGLAGVIQGTAGGLIFAALDLPGPVLWGVVMAILAFIPVIGISLVFVPTTIVLLLAGQSMRAALVFFPLMLLATVVEYWFKPVMVGRRAQMHTLLVFLSLLGGLEFLGPIGLLIGPLVMTAFITLIGIYRESYRPMIHLPAYPPYQPFQPYQPYQPYQPVQARAPAVPRTEPATSGDANGAEGAHATDGATATDGSRGERSGAATSEPSASAHSARSETSDPPRTGGPPRSDP